MQQRVIVEFVPGALVGQPPQLQVRMENVAGSWPGAVGMLLEGLKAATAQAFTQLQAQDQVATHFFVPDIDQLKR